ncbi:hypothetical protein Tco_0690648 [Tanacetum coccineum]
MGLWYPKGSGFELTAFSDVNHAGCIDTRKSTSGGIQFQGDKLVQLAYQEKQDCTAMSSAEAEYVALSASFAQVMWMRTQLQDYGFNYNKIPLYCDSQSAIAISCNLVQHSRTKHIHTRRPYALIWKPYQGDSLNLPDHRYIKMEMGDASFQQSRIIPHAHAQTTKTFYIATRIKNRESSRIKDKDSAQTLIYNETSFKDIKTKSREIVESFIICKVNEHVWSRHKIARWQRRSKNKGIRFKDLGRKRQSLKTMTKAQDQRSQSMKEQAYNVNRDKDHKSLTTKAISLISRGSVTMNSLWGRLLASKY